MDPYAIELALRLVTVEEGASLSARVVDNTVVDCSIGIDVFVGYDTNTISGVIANNVVTGASEVGVRRISAAHQTVTLSSNALWGNAVDLEVDDAAATDPGLVALDCGLDVSGAVPTLPEGSPCRGAADAALQPATDYWARSRIGADIGAVEFR